MLSLPMQYHTIFLTILKNRIQPKAMMSFIPMHMPYDLEF